MAITIYCFKFAKRLNSTKVPDLDAALFSEEVVLKEPTSLESPTFIISNANQTIEDLMKVNYILWNLNYYWVTRKTYLSNNRVAFDCRIDSLGSNRSLILDSEQFVLRSASYYNLELDDPLNPCSCENENPITVNAPEVPALLQPELGGVYLVEVLNGAASVVDIPSKKIFYALEPDTFAKFVAELSSTGFYNSLLKDINNPWTYISRIVWIPASISQLRNHGVIIAESTGHDIIIGTWYTTLPDNAIYVLASVQDYNGLQESIRFDLSSDLFTDYRDSDTRTQVQMFLPSYGFVDIPVSFIKPNYAIDLLYQVDIIGGVVKYILSYASEGLHAFAQYETGYGVDVPFGYMKTNVLGILGVAGTSLGNAAMSGFGSSLMRIKDAAVKDMIVKRSMLISGSAAFANSIGVRPVSGGVQGSSNPFINYYLHPRPYITISSKKSAFVPTDIKEKCGLLLHQKVRLSNLSGYCVCLNASMDISTEYNIVEEINNYLNGGFYIE